MKKLYNHNFPTPPYLAMNSFAINISDRSIKYGELVPTSNGLRLNKYGRERIESGIIVSGKIEKEDDLINIFKRIKDKEDIHYIRVSLSEEQMYLFTLSVPKANKDNLRDMILFQIEEYIPIKAIDSVFDYDIISEDNQNILVEVVAIASATIESYLSVFKKVGLIPLSFEIEAQAIARAVVPNEDTRPVMIVDFGDTRTGVSIFKNGNIFLTTTLAIGGTDLTNMIAKDFSLSQEEAEKMKHKYSLDQISNAQNIFPSILNGISVLRDELSKQYSYWETHNSEAEGSIDRIIFCGGDANLAGLADYLELSMKIKVENANVWVNVFDKIENSIPEMSFEESLSYATVIGLSLGGYIGKPQSIINILPYEEKKALYKEYRKRFFIILSCFVTLVGVVAILLLFPSYFLSKSKENLVESKIEIFNKENFDLTNNSIDKITININQKLDILDKAKESYQVSEKVLNNILSSRTNGITFSNILFNKKGSTKKEDLDVVQVQGVAINRDSLRNFKNTLDNNPNFSEVNLPISDFLEKTNLSFSILIKMK